MANIILNQNETSNLIKKLKSDNESIVESFNNVTNILKTLDDSRWVTDAKKVLDESFISNAYSISNNMPNYLNQMIEILNNALSSYEDAQTNIKSVVNNVTSGMDDIIIGGN